MKTRKPFILILLILSACAPLASKDIQDQPKKFIEFDDICCSVEKAYLDDFAQAFQKVPNATAYIIYYGGQLYLSCYLSHKIHRPRHGEAEARVARLKTQLVIPDGLDPSHIVIVNGGFRKSWMAELWIVPAGAKPPAPTPTLQKKDIRYEKGKVLLRKIQSDCEE